MKLWKDCTLEHKRVARLRRSRVPRSFERVQWRARRASRIRVCGFRGLRAWAWAWGLFLGFRALGFMEALSGIVMRFSIRGLPQESGFRSSLRGIMCRVFFLFCFCSAEGLIKVRRVAETFGPSSMSFFGLCANTSCSVLGFAQKDLCTPLDWASAISAASVSRYPNPSDDGLKG